MKVKPLDYVYEESQTENFQGTERDLRKKLNEGFYIIKGGNGSYVLSKSSVMRIRVKINGEVKNISVKDLIRDEYNKKRVTKKAFDVFKKDIKSGKKILYYDVKEGLTIR